jgi:hypothetical protein
MLIEAPAGKQDRIAARLYLLMPLILAALFALWLLSGVGTLLNWPASEALLKDSGLGTTAKRALIVSGALVDIGLAVALLWRRTARAAVIGMAVVTIAYLSVVSVITPSLWLEPLAPLAKALPAALLAIIAVWMLDKR